MRIFIVALLLAILTSVASAQSPLARRAFEKGAEAARAGRFEDALTAYMTAAAAERAAESGSGFRISLQYNIGVCYYRLGRQEEARAALTAAIRLSDGRHQRAFYALGMAESSLRNWPAARAAFRASLELAPKEGEAWFDLAIVYIGEEKYDLAAHAFTASIENRSVDSALGQNNLGVLMAMRSDYDAAEKAFAAALELSAGKLIEARNNLILCRRMRQSGRQLIADTRFAFATRDRRSG